MENLDLGSRMPDAQYMFFIIIGTAFLLCMLAWLLYLTERLLTEVVIVITHTPWGGHMHGGAGVMTPFLISKSSFLPYICGHSSLYLFKFISLGFHVLNFLVHWSLLQCEV